MSVMTAAAATTGDAPATVAPSRELTTGDHLRRLSLGQFTAVAVSVVLGLVVAGYGLAGSYVTVSELAARRGVPLAGWVPAGIDGGLIAVVVLDLVLAWIGVPVGWLRQLVRVLSVGTIAANAAGGWPDWIAVGLHSAAPLMLLAIVEAGRAVLLRRMGRANNTLRDSIPLVRWVLAPWRTWLLWRRMVLWQLTSYRQAVDTELELRRAMALLRTRYGRRWRRQVPADVVWMLRTGTHVSDACAWVRTTVELHDPALSSAEPVPAVSGDQSGSAVMQAVVHAAPEPSSRVDLDAALASRMPAVRADREQFSEAVRLNREHWAATGRPISAETLRKRLRLGAAKSRDWCRAIRDEDRAAVCGAGAVR
ncbi:DUF2637 domain-containing protein [Actinocrispum wychmicini]|uniref:Uncharacterized protein DUF2637 n=1 Tax=Actinocrispum wychmicini TaxID=1213861 RepID=A0A4R2ILL9_9PSEU|nr:DUF2637 domain-containing protein [Actinocrispum wychmicini]TCO45874.1 uncharacterized protein DUF2637 [Actinocrispum wychmicini]